MPMKPPMNEGTTFEPMPAGSYAARLYSIVHIGNVPSEWQGVKKFRDTVRLTFEFPTETKVFKEENGEQPYVLSLEFTYSLHEMAKLRPFLEGWRGKKFTDSEAMDIDLEEWVGKEGLANVVHSSGKNGKTYANIQAVSPLPKGMECPAPVNPPFILNYAESWSQEKFNSLPDFLKEKMRQSDQYAVKFQGTVPENEEIDLTGIPF